MSASYKQSDSLYSLIEGYKPLKFIYLGIAMHERYPYLAVLFRPLAFLQVRFYTTLGLPITYFHTRPLLSLEQRKTGDLRFITHYVLEHIQTHEQAGLTERLQYYRLWYVTYHAELRFIDNQMATYKHADVPHETHQYMLRWGYPVHVESSFVEFIHGTNAVLAKDALDSLI